MVSLTSGKETIVEYHDETLQNVDDVNTVMDPSRSGISEEGSSPSEFFSRPIVIWNSNWTIGSDFSRTFNPWSLYFDNPRVVNRTCNYKNLQANLKLKILVNGSPFHYGLALASYIPMKAYDDYHEHPRSGIQADIVEASQKPHVWLNPTDSTGGEMSLPMFWPFEAFSIPEASYQYAGSLNISTVVRLAHANAGTQNVRIVVMAWAENVRLTVPTNAEPATIAAQSEETGVVSGPANVVAKAARALKTVPSIAPYARALEIAASSTANVARAFGYSKPMLSGNDQKSYIDRIHNLGATSGISNAAPLTLDPKASVTVDPRVAGLDGCDEMHLQSIAARESYLTTLRWSPIQPIGSILMSTQVTPYVYVPWTTGGVNEYHMPACAYACQLFNFWRCTMVYKFKILAPSMYKGRIRISYDPQVQQNSEYNTNFSKVIDIAEEREIVVEVPMLVEYHYLERGPTTFATKYSYPDAVPPVGTVQSSSPTNNGTLQLEVLNEIVSPSASASSIAVAVFVSAKDLEVFCPTHSYLSTVTWNAPAPAVRSLPQVEKQAITYKICDNTTDPVHSSAIFGSDPVYSIRNLLKRDQTYTTCPSHGGAIGDRQMIYIPAYPVQRGYIGAGAAIWGEDWNYVNMTFLQFYMAGFSGYRGSFRYGILGNESDTSISLSSRNISRQFSITAKGGYSYVPMANRMKNFTDITHVGTNGWQRFVAGGRVPMVNVPYYEARRFVPANRKLYNPVQYGPMISIINTKLNNDPPQITHAAGDDFSLLFYLGPPICYFESDPEYESE